MGEEDHVCADLCGGFNNMNHFSRSMFCKDMHARRTFFKIMKDRDRIRKVNSDRLNTLMPDIYHTKGKVVLTKPSS